MLQMMKTIKRSFFVLVVLVVTGCTNNKWFLSTLYDRADNRLYSDILEYADFDRVQRQEIRLLIDQYHHWHRTTQLPGYAGFLEQLSERAYSKEGVALDEVYTWAGQIEDFVAKANECHPLIFASRIMGSLSSEQVEQIAIHARKEYDSYLKKYRKRSSDERFEKRYRMILKWLGRFRLNLDKSERQRLKETMMKEPKLREASFELWQAWDQEFHRLLLSRSDKDFAEKMAAHVRSLNTMMRDDYAEEVNRKLDLWVQYFQEIAQSEIDENRHDFAEWAARMSSNLRAISSSVPEEQSEWRSQNYCR